ncbi:MAG: glycosyltransferase family 2 protein [Aulosira sp. DedQUE10]|nr:glycosyltransferase family 2 protein [Aulosira sp. DedQUE10]
MSLKISLITPSFNSEKTIEKTIISVISQKNDSAIEYIIIDGGSTDSTCEIVKKYSDYIDLFISEPDKGPYDAMNKGITHATGDIIGIINSDDWYHDGSIKIVESEFIKNPAIDIIYAPVDNYFSGKFIATFMPGSLNKLPIRFTLNHPSCFIKKTAYDLVGLYDLQYKITADYDLILRLYLSNFKFHFVNIPLAAYSLNGMSSSTKPWDRAKLMKESWVISNKASVNLNSNLKNQRLQAYIAWIFNEIFAIPARYFLKPPLARKLKKILSRFIKNPISDEYGKW